MRAVLYAAKSTVDEKGSIPDQLKDGREIARDRDLEVVGEHQDENASAFHGNRGPGLEAAQAMCEQMSAEDGSCVLIVQHSDRLARGDGEQARSLAQFVGWALEHRVTIVSKQDPEMFPTNELREVLAAIGGFRNHQDSKRKSLSIKDGSRRRVERGLHHGRRPFGFGLEPTGEIARSGAPVMRLVADPVESMVITRIFREFAREGLSQREIARRLNRDGVPAQRGQWTQGSLSKVLSNPVYTGKLMFHGKELNAQHEPIIDAELWKDAQQLREANARTHRGRTPTANHLLAAGALRCGRCGSTMYAKTQPSRREGIPYEVYACSRRMTKGVDACDQPPIKRKPIDEAVLSFVTDTALDLEATKRAITEHAKSQIAEVAVLLRQAEHEVAKVERAQAKIERDYLHDELPADDYRRFRERLDTEHVAASASVTGLRDRHDTLAADPDDLDVEGALLTELTAIRAVILGQTREQHHEGAQALRTAIRRLFACFELIPANSFGVTTREGIVWPQDRPIAAGGYTLIPHVRKEALDWEAWEIRKQPLALRGSDDKPLTT